MLSSITVVNTEEEMCPNSRAANQHITIISEESSDTEDWCNGCWKSSL